jgi:cyclin H
MPTEDEIYRASTQYRLWNFTPEKLTDLRAKTNAIAKEHVRAAIQRKKKSSDTNNDAGPSRVNGNDAGVHNNEFYDGAKAAKEEGPAGNGTDDRGGAEDGADAEREIDYLTVEEEKILSDFFCWQLMNMASLETFQRFPTNVTVGSHIHFHGGL